VLDKFIRHDAPPLSSRSQFMLSERTGATTVDSSARRAYLIVLDLFHTSFGQRSRLDDAVRAFVERYLHAGDLAALVVLSVSPRASMFSSNPSVVLAALQGPGVSGRFAEGGLDLGSAEANEAFSGGTAAIDASATDRSLQQLAAVSRAFGALTGARKTVLFFSEGVATDLFAGANPQARDAAQRVLSAQQDFLKSAAAADVTVYPIDIRGLAAIDPFSSGEPPGLREWESLRVLADGTGGLAFVGRRDMTPVFDHIVQDADNYYELGYYSTQPSDGSTHPLEVMSRRPGVSLRTRPTAPLASVRTPPGPEPAMRALLDRALPVSDGGLRLRASAKVGQVATDTVRVDLQIEVLDWGPDDDRGSDSGAQVGVAIFDLEGRRVLERIAALPAHGRVLTTSITAPRGPSQIRVAVLSGTNRAGSVMIDADLR
jgi:VWFA-related protein